MFIIAVRKIATGEEITVPYFDCLLPFVKREQMCKRMGFHCVCKRCTFERSLGPGFAKIAESLDNVILTGRLLWIRNEPKKYLESIIEIAVRLEKEIEVHGNLITVEGRQLILASFVTLYSVIFSSSHLFSALNINMPSLPTMMEVAEAIQHAVPGSYGSFEMYACLLEGADDIKDMQQILQKAMEVGVSAFGRQEEHVLKSLLKAKPRWHAISKV